MKNPNYQDPVAQFAEEKAAAVATYLVNNADLQRISFEKIRSDFPSVVDPVTGSVPMTDGTIAEIFKVLGYEVIE